MKIFEIPLSNGQIVYMKKEEVTSDPAFEVDAKKFKELWIQMSGNIFVTAIKDDQEQTKYDSCEEKMANSQNNPIPFALLKNEMKGETHGFDDGCTRTKWLINHGAKSFYIHISPSIKPKLDSCIISKVD